MDTKPAIGMDAANGGRHAGAAHEWMHDGRRCQLCEFAVVSSDAVSTLRRVPLERGARYGAQDVLLDLLHPGVVAPL